MDKKTYSKIYYQKHKEYFSQKGKEYRQKNPDKIKELWKEWYQKNREKALERARKYRQLNREKIRERRKEWYRKYGKEYRQKHLERIRATARKWARLHPKPYVWNEARREAQRRYRERHKEELAEKRRIRRRERRKRDINYRLSQRLRIRIISAIKKLLGKKAYKSIELLGCSIQEAREYLEKQFSDGMSWENWGKVWEIDHIRPVASFDLTKPEEQKKAFHYTNLQPLFIWENRSKGAKLPAEQNNDIVWSTQKCVERGENNLVPQKEE